MFSEIKNILILPILFKIFILTAVVIFYYNKFGSESDFFDYFYFYTKDNFGKKALILVVLSIFLSILYNKNKERGYLSNYKIKYSVTFFCIIAIITFYVYEYTIVKYFGSEAWTVINHTPASTIPKLDQLKTGLTYISQDNFIFLIYMGVCVFLFYKVLTFFKVSKFNVKVSSLAILVFAIFKSNYLDNSERISIHNYNNQKNLYISNRSSALPLEKGQLVNPRTILFVMIETGAQFYTQADDGSKTKLSKMIVNKAGDLHNWYIFENAVTNSSASEVSIPSLFSGTAVEESIEKLHIMPRLPDMANVRGYEGTFFTSWQMQWANLDKFLLGNSSLKNSKQASDFMASPINASLINDIGVDDAFAIEEAQNYIESEPHEKKLFITLGLNALHVPFQTMSKFEIPDHIKSRNARAVYLTALAHEKIFESLKKSGRYDDALIIIVGDHGEAFDTGSKKLLLSRMFNLDDQILKISFLVKLPFDAPQSLKNALRSNEDALVANIDIAPTFAALLGVGLNKDLFWKGYNLLQPVPDDRLSIAANVTEWRSHPMTALALVRRHEKMVCNSSSGCTFESSATPIQADALYSQRKLNSYLQEALNTPVVKDNLIGIQKQMKIKNNKSAFIQDEKELK